MSSTINPYDKSSNTANAIHAFNQFTNDNPLFSYFIVSGIFALLLGILYIINKFTSKLKEVNLKLILKNSTNKGSNDDS